jgi:hypothetical protein
VVTGTIEPRTRAPEAEAKAPVAPQPAPLAAADAKDEPREVPAGPDPPVAAAAGRRVGRRLPFWLRAALVAGCWFGSAWLVFVAGVGSPGLAVAGLVAGAVAWGLGSASRWRWFLASLLVVSVTEAVFLAQVYFGGDVDYYLWEMTTYPVVYVAHYAYGIGGFLVGWMLLAISSRVLRRRRLSGA